MDEFNDSDISSLLNQIAGSSPDTMTAHKAVLGKVRRVRQRRVATVGAAAVVMVVSGAVVMVQNSQNRDGGSNIAVPLSPGDSQLVAVSTTIVPKFTTTTIDGAISIDPVTTEPLTEIPGTNSSQPNESGVVSTTTPSDTQAPTNSQGPSATTSPSNIPSPSTTISRSATTVPNSSPNTSVPKGSSTTTRPPTTNPPTTPAPIASPPTTQAPIITPPPTQPPVTVPPTTVPETKTWSCGGGSAKYQVTPDGLVLVETIPATGFTLSQSKAKSDEISVKFIAGAKNDKRKSALKIKKSGLVSTSCEDENFTRDSNDSDSESNDNDDESADD